MALRALETLSFSRTPLPNADIGKRGELKWLPLKDLVIDDRYQRAILGNGQANIHRMIEGFSWSLFAPLVVAKRANIGGKPTYAIIDGQHRATAAKMHGGITELPCLVLDCGLADEARAFAAINGNVTRLSNLMVFRAAVTAGDAEAVLLAETCARAGVTIAPYPKQILAPGETMGLTAVRRIMKLHGAGLLVDTLSVLRADIDASIPADAITGAADALKGVSDNKSFAAAVKSNGLKSLMESALRRKGSFGGTVWSNFSVALKGAASSAARGVDKDRLQRMMAGR